MLRRLGIAVTVFGCGWILMGLEIVGGRMLSSDFGSGVWVWGSVISVFLAALAVGYFLGGLLSQRFPHGIGLALVIFLAAACILPVAQWHRPIIGRISDWFLELEVHERSGSLFHERWGSLFAATTLFFVPSMLLGMVSPYAVRLVTRKLATVGASAGTLYAISTVGSCLGCLLTAFYFIVLMGIQRILFLSAGVLFLIAVGLLAVWHAGKPLEQQESPQ